PGDISWIAREHSTDEQLAAYGEASYKILNHVGFIAGLRVARQTDKYSSFVTGPYNGGATNVNAGEQRQTVVDPKVGINMPVDDNDLVYLTATKGDRIGGVNYPLVAIAQCLAGLESLGLHGAPLTY